MSSSCKIVIIINIKFNPYRMYDKNILDESY